MASKTVPLVTFRGPKLAPNSCRPSIAPSVGPSIAPFQCPVLDLPPRLQEYPSSTEVGPIWKHLKTPWCGQRRGPFFFQQKLANDLTEPKMGVCKYCNPQKWNLAGKSPTSNVGLTTKTLFCKKTVKVYAKSRTNMGGVQFADEYKIIANLDSRRQHVSKLASRYYHW